MIPPIILAYAARIGVKGAIIAALVLALGWQTARIEGVLWLDGLKADLAACERDKAGLVQAGLDAHERAVVARISEQRHLSDIAENVNEKHDEIASRAVDSTRAFALRARMRTETDLHSGGPVAAPGDSNPGIPVDLPASAIVATDYGDLQACTDATVYAVSAHDWAMDIDARNRAIEAGLNAPQ